LKACRDNYYKSRFCLGLQISGGNGALAAPLFRPSVPIMIVPPPLYKSCVKISCIIFSQSGQAPAEQSDFPADAAIFPPLFLAGGGRV